MDLQEIEREIQKIEAEKTSWANAERLSILYTVREHLNDDNRPLPQYSYSPERILLDKSNDSEFIKAFKSADFENALRVVDEHMTAISIVYPKEYSAVLRKLKEQK